MTNTNVDEREVIYSMIDKLSEHIHKIEERLSIAEVSVGHQGDQIGTLKHDMHEIHEVVECIKETLGKDGEDCGR